MARPELLDLALAAHGGEARWKAVRGVYATMRCGALAPAPFPPGAVRVAVSLHVPRLMITPHPRPGQHGLYVNDSVLIASDAGPILAERCDPPRAGQRLLWDPLDMLFHVGCALWNAMAVPFLLTRPGFALEELAPYEAEAGQFRRLRAEFPAWVPTHCREQVFHFGPDGRLWRHDFVPERLGSFRVGRTCEGYVEANGLMIPTRMRAHMRDATDRLWPWPPVAWIDLAQVQVV